MSNQTPPSDHIYGRLTGWKRLAIVALGAISGALVALLFSVFSGQPTPTWELILGALGGALLGLSASLGEVRRDSRRKKPTPDQPAAPPRGE
jgi:peptidoglycan/LPS O-acetylase OafA/YrhL